MAYQKPEEVKKQNIEKMGEALGTQFTALWQEVVELYINWSEFVELFASTSTRVDILNKAAPHFFRLVQARLLESTLLHVARLTDVSETFGRKDKANLTIRNLPTLIDDAKTKDAVTKLVETALKEGAFCKDWRNRLIAHRDLGLALDTPAVPLATANKKQIDAALKAIADVLNAVEAKYATETLFDLAAARHGAVTLLYVLSDGLKAQEKREERLLRGEISEDDSHKGI